MNVACGFSISVVDKTEFMGVIKDCNSKLSTPCRQTFYLQITSNTYCKYSDNSIAKT